MFLGATAVVTVAGLAGCSGGTGGDANGGGDGSTPEGDSEPVDTEPPATDTPDTAETTTQPPTTATSTAPTMESMCQVAQDSIEELSIVGCQSEGRDGKLAVDIRVRNDGQQETDLFEYDLTVTPYDAAEASDSNNIDSGGQSNTFNKPVVQPGETVSLIAIVGLIDSASPSDVQLYTITIECGTFSEGLYCE
jgi:hypothetical protein